MRKEINYDKLMQELVAAGCANWVSMADWRKNHPSSYNKFSKPEERHKICLAMGWTWKIDHGNEENFESLMSLTNRPSQQSKDPEEKRLAYAIQNLKKGRPELYQQLVDAKPDWFEDKGLTNFNILMSLTNRPNERSKDPEEKRLGKAIQALKTNRPDLYKQLVDAKPDWFEDKILSNFNILMSLTNRPKGRSKDPEEKRLGIAVQHLKTYRPDLYKQLVDAKPLWFEDKSLANFNILMSLTNRPNERSKDPEEKRLGIAVQHLKTYRPELYQQLKEAKPLWFEDKSLANFSALMSLADRPSQKSKDPEEKRLGNAIQALKTNRPELYQQLKEAKPLWIWK